MKLGFFTMPIHPLGKDWRTCLREDREAFILADELGFTEGYVGEHATDKAENITSCALFIATLADATKNIRLGTGTVNMPNAHPAAVASQIAMLDHLLDGRFNFGISPGGLLSDAEAFGTLDKDRTAMFVEAIDMVLDIWKSEPPYNLKGEHWTVSTEKTMIPEIGQGILPKPLQTPHPPIIVTAVALFQKASSPLRRAAGILFRQIFSCPNGWPVIGQSMRRVASRAADRLTRLNGAWPRACSLQMILTLPESMRSALKAPTVITTIKSSLR